MAQATIEEVKSKYTEKIMKIPGVIGLGIGEEEGETVIKVFVVKKAEEVQRRVPDRLEGYRVVLMETGTIRAL